MSEIRLADFVENLREELTTAMALGHGNRLRFDLQEVEVEAQVTVNQEGGGNGKVSFNVLGVGAEVGAEGKRQTGAVHTVKLKLKPWFDPMDGTTRKEPVDLSASTPARG